MGNQEKLATLGTKKNTPLCASKKTHHYAQANTNNVNKA